MDADTTDRKKRILGIALECFSQLGFERTSTRMIQEGAGVSTGSFYHHFGSKAGVAAELYLEGLRDKNRAVAAELGRARGAEQGIRAVVGAHVRWIAANPAWAGFLYQHRAAVPKGRAENELEEINRAFSALLMDFFRPYFEDGTLRSLPAECYSPILLGPVQEYARRWLKERVGTDISTLEPIFADAAWNALRAR